MAHTQTPWAVGTGPNPETQVFDASGAIVADCHWTNQERPARIANARLIAAAPDLLAALQALADSFALLNPLIPAPCAEAVTQARAAIAKAIGDAA